MEVVRYSCIALFQEIKYNVNYYPFCRFSGGPMSQNDTIELRGFDDADKPGKKKISLSQVKRAKEWSKKKETIQNATLPYKGEIDEESVDNSRDSGTKAVVSLSNCV